MVMCGVVFGLQMVRCHLIWPPKMLSTKCLGFFRWDRKVFLSDATSRKC